MFSGWHRRSFQRRLFCNPRPQHGERSAVNETYTLARKQEVFKVFCSHSEAEAERHFKIPCTIIWGWKGLDRQPKNAMLRWQHSPREGWMLYMKFGGVWRSADSNQIADTWIIMSKSHVGHMRVHLCANSGNGASFGQADDRATESFQFRNRST